MTRDDDGYQIDFHDLESFIKKLASFRELTEARMGYLDDVVEALAEKWSGEAWEAYTRAHAEWRQGAQSIQDALEDIRTATKNSHSAYTGLQAHQRKMWPS
ncbi:WXG100 family type VII secretion target [Tsukamurella strandjordii]|uniref:ESAT-6-like protein n=1 Tax=Tsukamurella strandjordii TaxID=147577 RepID=A0AA90NCK1_9ACTN|nr:WXG100 family type VII secretion target [Tsukamurella strandjordii]MDP0400007.1 WXG100 family type VII secretion target [Tsukamurella strandjordii]